MRHLRVAQKSRSVSVPPPVGVPRPGESGARPARRGGGCDNKLGLSTRENVKATTRPLQRIKPIGVCGVGRRRRLGIVDVTGSAAIAAAAAAAVVGWVASRCPAAAVADRLAGTERRSGRWHCRLVVNGKRLPGCYHDRRVSQRYRYRRGRLIAGP